MSSPLDAAVLVTVNDGVGRLMLNRPRAINALSHEMVHLITDALGGWRFADQVRTVVIDGNGDRGLCAGGDIRAIYDDGIAGGNAAESYWADEYRLNATIARYPKPIVVLMDGIVMGGGVGLAAHASHRIVNETSSIGLPEVAIGFTPDVGATYLLARAPGELGLHLGLGAHRMAAADAIYCGFADAMVPVATRTRFIAALSELGADEAQAAFSVDAGVSALSEHGHWIDVCYSGRTVEEIIDRLQGSPVPDAGLAAQRLGELSPTALKVTLRAIRAARADPTVELSLARELRVSVRSLAGHDFMEGIRAQVIDKDRTPTWQPADLADVGDSAVEEYFTPLGDRELRLDSVHTRETAPR